MKPRNSTVFEIPEDIWQNLENLYARSFDQRDAIPGVLLGQVDLFNGKMKFVAFDPWEYRILQVAFWIVNLVRKTDTQSLKHPYTKNAFWLGPRSFHDEQR